MSKQEESFALPRVWSAMLLLLIAVTYPLWVSPLAKDSIPAVPLFSGVASSGPVFGHQLQAPAGFLAMLIVIPSVLIVGSLAAILLASRRFQTLWWVVTGSFVCSFLIDQHRLQPWAYQSALYGLAFAVYPPQRGIRVLIPLAASVYIYSGVGKIDYQFAHTVGQDFLGVLAFPLGGLPDTWNPTTRAYLALVFPATELLAGIGLLVRSTRKAAGILLMLMHLTLIGILGPGILGGLNHSSGVLVWNALLLVQAYLLSKNCLLDQRDSPVGTQTSWIQTTVQGLIVAAIIAPLFERQGYWDHWTSWALYAPHTSRVEVEVHQSTVDSLPTSLAPFVSKDTDNDRWHKLDLTGWSLDQRSVPIYPQARYQLALAVRLADRLALEDAIRATVRSVSDRRTGRRTERRLLGQQELASELRKFWLTW